MNRHQQEREINVPFAVGTAAYTATHTSLNNTTANSGGKELTSMHTHTAKNILVAMSSAPQDRLPLLK